MVRGYPLTKMAKRHVAKRVAKEKGGVQPRFYKTQDKPGFRAYIGRKYVGYFASKKAANDAIHKPLVEQKPERTAQKA